MKDRFFEKVATPEVRVLVRGRVVVNVKQSVVLVLVVVATAVQTRVRSVEVPVVARINAIKPSDLRSQPLYRKNYSDEVCKNTGKGAIPLEPPYQGNSRRRHPRFACLLVVEL